MKQFTINEVLIYNPNLISKLKKAIESDIQQAKIIAFYPLTAPIEQKCNAVGMAEGVYEFCRSLQPTAPDQQQQKPKQSLMPELDKALGLNAQEIMEAKDIQSNWQQHKGDGQVITMDTCALVLKEIEENIWIFIKLEFLQNYGEYTRKEDQDDQQDREGYLFTEISEDQCLKIVDHFYRSFVTFYGSFQRYLGLEKLDQLNNTLEYFVFKYHVINSTEELPNQNSTDLLPLCITNYLFTNLRAIPLDTNSTLKFQYFKNVLKSYDPQIIELMVFSSGYLAYSSLDRETTEFFAKYLYGMGQPYRFDGKKIATRFEYLQLNQLASKDVFKKKIKKYGLLFNSLLLGFEEGSIIEKSSVVRNTVQPEQDLLGLSTEAEQTIPLLQIYSPKPPYQKVYLNYYSEKKMAYLTFYKGLSSQNQIVFQNRFFHDNNDRFLVKITDILTGVLSQNDAFRFLYCNCSTGVGKSTLGLKNKQILGPVGRLFNQLINLFEGQNYLVLGDKVQKRRSEGVGSVMASTYKDYWIYGVKRMNRMLVLLIPSEIPLQKLDEFASKMTKEYFAKAYL